MRSSLLDEIGQDYVTTARAKGLRDDEVRRRHAVPNAMLPTVTLVFMRIGFVVGGAVTVEAIFSWPGLGQLFYEAIRVPDFTLMQGTFMLITVSVIVMNTLADVVYHVLDPEGEVGVSSVTWTRRGRRVRAVLARSSGRAGRAWSGSSILVVAVVLALVAPLFIDADRDERGQRDRRTDGAAEPGLPARAPTSPAGRSC